MFSEMTLRSIVATAVVAAEIFSQIPPPDEVVDSFSEIVLSEIVVFPPVM